MSVKAFLKEVLKWTVRILGIVAIVVLCYLALLVVDTYITNQRDLGAQKAADLVLAKMPTQEQLIAAANTGAAQAVNDAGLAKASDIAKPPSAEEIGVAVWEQAPEQVTTEDIVAYLEEQGFIITTEELYSIKLGIDQSLANGQQINVEDFAQELIPQAIATTSDIETLSQNQSDMQAIANLIANAPFALRSDQPIYTNPLTATTFVAYEWEGGIPWSGSEWNADVAPREIEVLTAGPVSGLGFSLPGGADRGSIVLMLGGDTVVTYALEGMLPGSNWHGAYAFADKPQEATWRELANFTAEKMGYLPDCTPGEGCLNLDTVVLGPTGIIAQWTLGEPPKAATTEPSATQEPALGLTTATPGPTNTPTPAPTASLPVITFADGEEKIVAKGYVVKGDIDAWDGTGWKALYDNDGTSGLVTVLTEDTKVRAQWGASASVVTPETAKSQLLVSGCGSKCSSVSIVYWPEK